MTTSHNENERLRFIHGLRAIAALWVLIAHSLYWAGMDWSVLPNPKVAVDLFMVLSGLLMIHSVHDHSSDRGETDKTRWPRFYVRRFFRIAPMYYLTLFVVASSPWHRAGYAVFASLPHRGSPAVDVASNADFSPLNLLAHVSFVFGLLPSKLDSTLLPDWSLTLEMQFYLLFPALYLLGRRLGFSRLVIFGVLPVYVIAKMLNRQYGVNGAPLFVEPSFLPLSLHVFSIGMLLGASALEKSGTSERQIGALVLALAVSCLDIRNYGWTALSEPVFVFLIWSLLKGRPQTRFWIWVERLLSGRVAKLGSDASYSVYLLHGLVLAACGRILFTDGSFLALSPMVREAITVAIVASVTYPIALACHRWIEKPGIRIGARILRRAPASREHLANQPTAAGVQD